jgi:hypothetical protein
MENKKRPGRSPKDAVILNGFNQTKIYEADPATKREMLLEKRRLYRKAYRKAKKEDSGVKEKALGVDVEEDDAKDTDDEKSAYQMLQDMRWVYRTLKGRDKLKALVKGDDKQFVFMVKELMRIETALLSAKIRAKETPGDGGNRTVFVVLKGLEEEKPMMKLLSDSKDVDMQQVARAIKPDGSEYEVNGKEEEVHFQVKGR